MQWLLVTGTERFLKDQMRNCTTLYSQKEYFWIQLPNNKILISDVGKTALLREKYIYYKRKIYQASLLEIECVMSENSR